MLNLLLWLLGMGSMVIHLFRRSMMMLVLNMMVLVFRFVFVIDMDVVMLLFDGMVMVVGGLTISSLTCMMMMMIIRVTSTFHWGTTLE